MEEKKLSCSYEDISILREFRNFNLSVAALVSRNLEAQVSCFHGYEKNMGCCAAINCSNRSDRKGKYKLFRFPTDPIRRKRWTLNCRRKNWSPGKGAYLCEAHFDYHQFEWHRADGHRKLKPNAVPTIFSIPGNSNSDEPKHYKRTRKSKYKAPCVIYLCPNSIVKEEVPDSASDSHTYDEHYFLYSSVSTEQNS